MQNVEIREMQLKNRISRLKVKPVVNANLIRKAERNLRNLKNSAK